MRILHIGEYVNGGIGTYWSEVVGYQSRKHDVHVLMSRHNSQCSLPLEEHRIHYYEYKRHLRAFPRAMRQIAAVIDQIQPDIIHLHSTFAGLLTRAELFFRKDYSFKVIYCAHGWSFIMDVPKYKKRVYAWIERILASQTDLIINISNYEMKQALQYGLPGDRSTMVYNGVAERSRAEAAPVTGLQSDKINLLFIGRFDYAKGLDILVELFRTYELQHVTLYTIGGSVLGDQRIDLPEGIVHLGWIDNDRIDGYYAMCDAVIMPSRWEGFGLVAVEAMRNGKAVICSNRAALPELVQHEVNGYLFEIEQPEQLLSIIQSLDRSELERLGEQGRRIYQERFTSTRMNLNLEMAYERLFEEDSLDHTSDVAWEVSP